ncbi:MAG: hypothetical protein ACYCO0_00355 [Candidatus Micrarchaeaceae archaeon]
MNKSKLFQFGLAFFVAAIFLSSYFSLINYNPQQSATTAAQTVLAVGIGNATLTGYGGAIYFNITSKNTALRSIASNIINSNLTLLEVNNSIIGPSGSQYNISAAPENMSTYKIYLFIAGKLNTTLLNSTQAYATAHFQLPQEMNFSIGLTGTQIARLPILQRNQSVSAFPLRYAIGSFHKIKVIANLILNRSNVTGATSGGMTISVLS